MRMTSTIFRDIKGRRLGKSHVLQAIGLAPANPEGPSQPFEPRSNGNLGYAGSVLGVW